MQTVPMLATRAIGISAIGKLPVSAWIQGQHVIVLAPPSQERSL
jgi:hypothetical protein